MTDIDDAQALSALKDWAATVGTYWNYFGVVSLGAVGFALNIRPQHLGNPERIAVAGAFLLFAIGNHTALIVRQKVFVELANAMRKRERDGQIRPTEYAAVFRSIDVPSVKLVRAFHIATSVIVVAIVWLAMGPTA
jgi:hypothetical protein